MDFTLLFELNVQCMQDVEGECTGSILIMAYSIKSIEILNGFFNFIHHKVYKLSVKKQKSVYRVIYERFLMCIHL